MPTFKKIPKKIKDKGCVASGRFCVFAGLLQAGNAFVALEKADKKGSSIPVVGFITVKGKRYYYCLSGFINDPDIYSK